MILDNIKNFSEVTSEIKMKFVNNCTKCHGIGVIKNQAGNYVECNCSKKAKIVAREICNGIPKKFISNKWEDLNDNLVGAFKEYISNIGRNIDSINNILMLGEDKIEIVKSFSIFSNYLAFKKNRNGYFFNIVMCDLNDLLQASYAYKTNYEYKNIYNNIIDSSDVLIINFIGSEMDTRVETTAKYISNIITRRALNGKLTFISSVLRFDELSNKYGSELSNLLNNNYQIMQLNNNSNVGKEDNNERGYY